MGWKWSEGGNEESENIGEQSRNFKMSDEMMTDVDVVWVGDTIFICVIVLVFLRSYSSCIPKLLILALGTVLKTPDFIIDMDIDDRLPVYLLFS